MKRVITFIAACIVFLSQLVIPVLAAEDSTVIYEIQGLDETTVADDLTSMGMSLDDYPLDDSADSPTVIRFLEYGFAADQAYKKDFALYLYVYNPLGYDLWRDSMSNTITMATDYSGKTPRYEDIPLQILSDTNSPVLKFRIGNSDSWYEKLYQIALDSGRKYSFSKFTLKIKGEGAKAFPIASTYSYSGYSKGFGPGAEKESTLTCSCDGITTIQLTLHPTVYRHKNGSDTSDLIYAVYFSISDDYLTRYGDLYSVDATAVKAVCEPIVVVNNYATYSLLNNYVGYEAKDVQDTSTEPYALFGLYNRKYVSGGHGMMVKIGEEYYYGFRSTASKISGVKYTADETMQMSWLFRTEDLKNDVIYAEELQAYAEKHSDLNLYQSMEKVNFNLTADKLISSEGAGRNPISKFFLQMFGLDVNDVSFSEVSEPIKYSDIVSLKDEEIANNYGINVNDVGEFRRYVSRNSLGRSTYVLHFAKELYTGGEAKFFNFPENSEGYLIKDMVSYLDFNVIDLGFLDKSNNLTIIPTVSQPVNVIPPIEDPSNVAPPNIPSLGDMLQDFMRIIIGILCLILVIFIVFKIISLLLRLRKPKVVVHVDSQTDKQNK